jgi:hypothetical protein
MNLQDDLINQAARQLANDIDTEVLMSAMGWHKLEISEGRIYGARYLTVHPNNGAKWNEMMEWMVKTFGPTPFDSIWMPDQRWHVNNAKFWFRDAKDRDWFVLRWS